MVQSQVATLSKTSAMVAKRKTELYATVAIPKKLRGKLERECVTHCNLSRNTIVTQGSFKENCIFYCCMCIPVRVVTPTCIEKFLLRAISILKVFTKSIE